jgi:hypothetical protein
MPYATEVGAVMTGATHSNDVAEVISQLYRYELASRNNVMRGRVTATSKDATTSGACTHISLPGSPGHGLPSSRVVCWIESFGVWRPVSITAFSRAESAGTAFDRAFDTSKLLGAHGAYERYPSASGWRLIPPSALFIPITRHTAEQRPVFSWLERGAAPADTWLQFGLGNGSYDNRARVRAGFAVSPSLAVVMPRRPKLDATCQAQLRFGRYAIDASHETSLSGIARIGDAI